MSKERFHVGNIRVGDWFVGIHFERVLNDLFKQKNEQGQILLQPAAGKAADGIDQVLTQWTIIKPIFDVIVSNEGQTSADKAKADIIEIRDDLREIQITTDIPKYLDEYSFAKDDNRNKFYHEFITILFTSFSDGNFSPIEFGAITSRLLIWIKEGR